MTRKQLEQLRESVEEQLRWALLHDGDQELLDLLRIESDRLSTTIGQCPDLPMAQPKRSVSRPAFPASTQRHAKLPRPLKLLG